jgi:hypothetical protein
MSQAGLERQMAGTALATKGNSSSPYHNEVLTIGEALYRLTGLLALQRLYAALLDEKKQLEAHLAKQYQVNDQLSSREKSCSSGENHGGLPRHSQMDESKSPFSPLYRSLHLQLENYGEKMADIEDKTAKGLIQENFKLKQLYQRQQAVMQEMEQELELYRQFPRSPTDQASLNFTHEHIVKKLSENERLLSIERTLSQELGIQLEQRSREVDILQERLDLERFGRRRTQAQINTLLNDFVVCCLQLSEVASSLNAKKAFDELLSKSQNLCEFGVEITTAVQLALEDCRKTDFLRLAPSEVEDNNTDISLDEALEKISQFRANEQRLRREAKHQVIEQMRKHKHAAMRAKDLEERLKKSDAEKQLMEVHLGEEIHKLSTELDTLKQTLGHRSSYASKAAQSVKSLVELTEGQKSELEYQRDCLSTQLAILQQNQDKLKGRNQHLEASAMEEATARVRETLGSLESQCESLRNENKIRKEQFDVLQETLKRDQDILKSKTDTVYKLEKQVSCHVTAAEVVESG